MVQTDSRHWADRFQQIFLERNEQDVKLVSSLVSARWQFSRYFGENNMPEYALEIYKDKAEKSRWRRRDSNKEIVGESSEGYKD